MARVDFEERGAIRAGVDAASGLNRWSGFRRMAESHVDGRGKGLLYFLYPAIPHSQLLAGPLRTASLEFPVRHIRAARCH